MGFMDPGYAFHPWTSQMFIMTFGPSSGLEHNSSGSCPSLIMRVARSRATPFQTRFPSLIRGLEGMYLFSGAKMWAADAILKPEITCTQM